MFNHPKNIARELSFLAISMYILASCSVGENRPVVDENTPFAIVVMGEGDIGEVQKYGYTQNTSWPVLLQEYAVADHAVVFSQDDVEEYLWSKQEITLTVEATDRFLDTIGCSSTDIMGNPVCALDRSFLVVVDGKPLYGGLFMNMRSELAIEFPVIYGEIRGANVVLSVRPFHGAHLRSRNLDDSYWFDLGDSQWGGIMDGRIEAIFTDLGKITR